MVIDTGYVTRSIPYAGKYGGLDITLIVQALRFFKNDYNVILGFTDTCAMQGAISFQSFLDNVGISVRNKKIVKESEKSNMIDVSIIDPARLSKYATSELLVFKALLNQEELIKDIYIKL